MQSLNGRPPSIIGLTGSRVEVVEEPKSKKSKTSTLELEEELVNGGEKELKDFRRK